MKNSFILLTASLLAPLATLHAADAPPAFNDPKPQRYELTARASEIDPRARPHPEIDFVFEKGGKPADVENASVDTRVPAQGKLVIWLMSYRAPLFERVNSYLFAHPLEQVGQPVPHDPACPLDLRPPAKKSAAADK